MKRQHPNPTEKSKKDKTKKHPPIPHTEPPKNGTMQTAGLLLLGGGGFFATVRYFFGELWAKEIARKFYDWIWPKIYDDFTWYNPFHVFRTMNFMLNRVHFQQHAPTYFFYFVTVVAAAIPTSYVTWRKYIKPRFFCKTDPATDDCIDPHKPCAVGECKEGEEPDSEESDDDQDLICEQRTELIAGRAIQVQVCLTAADREALEQAKRKEALAAARQKANVKKEKVEDTSLQTQTVQAAHEKAAVSASIPATTGQNPAVLAQVGDEIDLQESCDCEEDPDLTLPKTLLNMAGSTPKGSRFTGSSKHRRVKTSESRESTDTKACEHKTEVDVAETGEQSQNNRSGFLLTRLFH